MSRRGKAFVVLSSFLLLPVIMGLNLTGCGSRGIPGVKVQEAARTDMSLLVSAVGTLEPSGAVDVVCRSNCVLEQLLVSDGDEVEAGEVLATLQVAGLEQQAQQANANYLNAAAMGDLMSGMWNNSTLSYDVITGTVQGLGAMQSQVDSLALTFFDLAPTLATMLPPETQQQVLQVVQAQKSQYLESMNNRVQPQVSSPSGYPSSAAAADRERRRLAAEQNELAQAAKNDPRIVAPVAGAVVFQPPSGGMPTDLINSLTGSLSSLTGSLGALGGISMGGDFGSLFSDLFPSSELAPGTKLQAGQAAFRIVDLQNMRVKAEVEESDIVKVRKGQRVQVMLDAYPDHVFWGTVVQVGAKGSSGSSGATVFPVTIQMERSEVPLKIGFNATVDIEVSTREEVVAVPVTAVVRSGREAFVYVVDKGAVTRREVATGLEAEDMVEIVEGLEPGELVVTEGVSKVKPGDRL
jgi:HlyD family secretion protein